MRTLIILSIALLLNSCSNKKSKYALDEKSEMATLMLEMHSDLQDVQTKIKAGEDLGEMPTSYLDIVTAKMTNERQRKEGFETFAKNHIEVEKKLFSAPKTEQKTAYQNVVNSCIACHTAVACRGPLPKIKKLMWKEE